MKTCSYCGEQYPEDASLCPVCGAESAAPEADTDELGSANLVTVFSAFNPADAQLARSRLDAAGFHAIVTNELSALSMDGYALAAGGILVQVPEAEAADAKEFLNAPPVPPE